MTFTPAVPVASPQNRGDSSALDRVRLAPLMSRTAGRPEVTIGVIDGPVDLEHPDLEQRSIRALAGRPSSCSGEDVACIHGALVVVAAGDQATLASSILTRHPWALPVVACAVSGRPVASATLSRSTGTHGLCAPGDVISLAPGGGRRRLVGSSAAAPFVTGAAALIWSQYPGAHVSEIRLALTGGGRRSSVVPPLLDAWSAYCELT